jgi:isocitrate/isopropylmalate dehydrogenase
MMLDWLGEADVANRLEHACARVIKEGEVGTYDVKKDGAPNTTLEAAEEVAKHVNEAAGV